jgi:uncharacterized protein DUF6072
MSNEAETSNLQKVLMVAGESVVPGGSHVVKGDLKQAGIHAVFGLAAKAAFGIPGLILVSASSLSKALTGRSVLDQFSGGEKEEKKESIGPAKGKPS